MAITITTKTNLEQITEIAEDLRKIKSLTPRSIKELQKNDIAIAMDGNIIVGWLIREKLTNNVYEIGGAYVKPRYRKRMIFSRMFESLTSEPHYSYLLATYSVHVAEYVRNKQNFKPVSLIQIAKITKARFITKRIKYSVRVMDHLSNAKVYYFARLAQ